MKRIYGDGLVAAVLFVVVFGGGVKWKFTTLSVINEISGKVFAQEVQIGLSVSKRNFERVLTLEERKSILYTAVVNRFGYCTANKVVNQPLIWFPTFPMLILSFTIVYH